jgi:thiol-disulfide isomerase/thioredoxin
MKKPKGVHMKIFLLPLFLMMLMASLIGAEKTSDKFHYNLLSDAPMTFDQSGNNVFPKHIVSQKYLFLYFSASWCGPCHKFNPKLIEWYNSNGGGKDFEIILVGRDEDTASIKRYVKDQKFPFIAFEKKGKRFEEISKKYCGPGIPCLVLLNEKDEVIADSYKNGKYLGPQAPLEYYEKNIKNK